jgi:hypothetical protein
LAALRFKTSIFDFFSKKSNSRRRLDLVEINYQTAAFFPRFSLLSMSVLYNVGYSVCVLRSREGLCQKCHHPYRISTKKVILDRFLGLTTRLLLRGAKPSSGQVFFRPIYRQSYFIHDRNRAYFGYTCCLI